MVRETLYVLLVLLHLLLEAAVIAPNAGPAAVLLVFAYWTSVYCIEHLMLRRGHALLLRRSLWAVMFPVFTLPVGAYLFLKGALDTELNPDIVHAVMQTTPAEVLEFSSQYFLVQFIVLHWLVFGVAATIPSRRLKLVPVSRPTGLLFLGLVCGVAIVLHLAEKSSLYQMIAVASRQYQDELTRYSKLAAERRAQLPLAGKTGPGETFLVVIGESASRDYMSAYGFPEVTTPYLSAMAADGRAVVLQRAYSNHTHTNPSLSLALTEANQYNGKRFENSASVIQIAKAAGFATYWLSNQPRYGAFNNHTSVLSENADVVRFINKGFRDYADTAGYDENLVTLLEQVPAAPTGGDNTLIFMHLMGSHAAYCNRFPREFGKSTDPLTCYKSSLRYTDHVLNRIIQSFVRKFDRGAVIYFSDHGERMDKNRGHNSGNFSFSMARIPVFFAFTNKFAAEHAQQISSLKSNAGRVFTNDLIFDVLIGLAGIQYAGYDPGWDISSPRYRLSESEALTLHGRRHIIEDFESFAR